ncbi:hypothetical protein ACFXKC_43615 [Streptomyces sp. NPDC059340]|uniref:hypothetical protein n=1 Tax=Streptomyces sp. NPDC059340 TaxID=3346806 RepID=UPI0036CA1F7C
MFDEAERRDPDREREWTDPAAEAWVGQSAFEILEGRAEQVADVLEARAEAEELDAQRRFGVDKAIGYDIALAEGWDRHRRDRGGVPAPGQRPDGHHRRPLGPDRGRGCAQAPRGGQQR